MRKDSSVKAGTARSANAFFTMIALVENKTAPRNVIRNPASGITFLLFSFFNALQILFIRSVSLFPVGEVGWGYTHTLKSLKASFKLVFKSVLGLRLPMIKAQLTPKEPAGKSLL